MRSVGSRRWLVGWAAGFLALATPSAISVGPAPAGADGLVAATQAGSLALANVGKGAGTCSTVNPSLNSLGGAAFASSCHGYAGLPEYWCADFASWVWQHSGLYVAGLTAAAASFVTSGAGTVHADPSYAPQVGDAVVFNFDGASYADHVGLVAAINPDGSVVTVNGDFGGKGSGAAFARTSLVRSVTIRARSRSVGSTPGRIGMTITDYVTPRLAPPSSPAATVDANGHPNVFWRDASGQLRHTWSSGGVWQGTDTLASGLLEDPVAGSMPDVAWVAIGGGLRRSAFNGGHWAAPEALPTDGQRLAGRPAIATDVGGVENLFWRGPDRRLYHDYLIGGSWVGPEAIGDGLRSDPVAISVPATGELVVLAQGPRHTLALSRFADGRWQGSVLPVVGSSVVGRPSVAIDPAGPVDVFWRQRGGQLELARLDAGVLGSASSVGSSDETAPVGTSSGSTVAAAFGSVEAHEVRISSTDGGAWTPDQIVVRGRQVPGEPAVLATADGLVALWVTQWGSLQSALGSAGSWGAATTVWRP